MATPTAGVLRPQVIGAIIRFTLRHRKTDSGSGRRPLEHTPIKREQGVAMSKSDNKKTINFVTLDEDVFDWLKLKANQAGEKIADFAGHLITLEWARDDPRSDDSALPPMVQLQNIYWQGQRREKARHRLLTLAASINRTNPPDSRAVELLIHLCDLFDFNYDDLLLEISEPSIIAAIEAQSAPGTKLGDCIIWLVKTFTETPEIPQQIVETHAEKIGYTEITLRRARAAINRNPTSPFVIESIRIPGNNIWHWKAIYHKPLKPGGDDPQ